MSNTQEFEASKLTVLDFETYDEYLEHVEEGEEVAEWYWTAETER